MEIQHAPLPERASDAPAAVRLCVIDLGTNSFHAIVVDAFPDGTFDTIARRKEMVRLGEGAMTTQYLSEAAWRRGLGALTELTAWAHELGTEDIVARATSAIREATNGGAYIEAIRDETGIHVKTISGEVEAQLIYAAVRHAVDLTEPTLLVDIGGGSTELVIADREGASVVTSLKLGAARLTEMFVTTDPVDRSEFRALREYIRSELAPVMAAARARGIERVVGTSGTLQAIATATAAAYGTPERIFEHVFGADSIRRITKSIMRADRATRLGIPGISARRVDQVVAGAAVIDIILKDLGIRRFEMSPAALREGIVIDFIAQNYKWLRRIAPYRSIRRRNVYDLAMRLGWDEAHVRHVTRMALQLFDATAELHHFGEAERELLEYASVVRDVGYAISRRGHHRHSYYVIRNADLSGFSPGEIAVIAHVARLHRRGRPSEKHPDFAKQPPARQQLISRLAAILRLANGLDRSHFQNVIHLDCRLESGHLHLTIQTKADPQLDLWAGRRGADLFGGVFGCTVTVDAEG